MTDTLLNFRDLGGLRTTDGRVVRHGRLFRSDDVGALDPAAWHELQLQLGLTTAIDMRSGFEDEMVGGAAAVAGGVQIHRVPILDGSMAEMAQRGEMGMHEMYRHIALDAAPSIAAAVDILAAQDGLPGLVFCTAGKDRTGVLMALLLAAVGVTRTDVVADYTRSGPAGHAIRERFAARYHDRVVQVPPEMFEAPAPVIEAVLDEVDATFGSAAGYFDSHGVDAAALAALTAKLVG